MKIGSVLIYIINKITQTDIIKHRQLCYLYTDKAWAPRIKYIYRIKGKKLPKKKIML